MLTYMFTAPLRCSLQLSSAAKQQARLLLRAHMIRMHAIVDNHLCARLDAVKALLPAPLGAELASPAPLLHVSVAQRRVLGVN